MKSSAFLIRILICFLLSWVPLNDLESHLYSIRLSLRGPRPAPTNVMIVEIESPNLLEFYWDPYVYREVLRTLLPRNPSALIVTWFIPKEIVDPLDPELSTLIRTPKLIWSSHFDPEGKYLKPAPRLIAKSSYGFSNLFADNDSEVRASVLTREGHPSLIWSTLNLLNEAPTLPLSHPQNQQSYLINYVGSAGSIPRCRFSEIVSGRASESCLDFKNKVVLLEHVPGKGLENIALFKTPFGLMDRAEILANELDTILNHQTIKRASWLVVGLIALAMNFLTAFLILYYEVLFSAVVTLGSGTFLTAIVFQVLFQFLDFYIPTANISFGMLVTYLVFTGYRLAFQETLQWRTLKQGQYLRELDQMKTNFLSLISHDLKTPIAKIQAAVEGLRREAGREADQDGKSANGDSPSSLTTLLQSIEASNNELRHYITSILNLSKIESQKVILNKKSNDINQIIEQVLTRMAPLAHQWEVSFEKQLEPLFAVECDEDLIKQVLTNIVDNAIKHSPKGSKIIVRSQEIEKEGVIRVDVQDFGPGIPNDQIPLMFRKFSRFQRPLGEKVQGTGLGLYLSKYFIELHGGTIELDSPGSATGDASGGKGTTFSFTLPV